LLRRSAPRDDGRFHGSDQIQRALLTWTSRFAALFPNAFAMVMATGIVSLDAQQLGYHGVGWALFAIVAASWLLLWAAGAMRVRFEGRRLGRELGRHETGPGFLTIVAGTGILGSLFAAYHVALILVPVFFAFSGAFWWVTQYGFLAGVSEGRDKPPLEQGLSGQWLLLVVATQAVASLGADVLRQASAPPSGLVFACYAGVLLGAVYYLLLGSVVLYRFAFVAMPPSDITGPWWINEGAAAITTLAGSKLMAAPGLMIGHFTLRSLLAPVVIAFWTDATFWIPLLVLLFAWKHAARHRPLRYTLSLWSVVFPLGMYCAATQAVADAYGLGLLHPLAVVFFWIALLAWGATFLGAAYSMTA
jgi:tellurite resistance protein TehA-like permease